MPAWLVLAPGEFSALVDSCVPTVTSCGGHENSGVSFSPYRGTDPIRLRPHPYHLLTDPIFKYSYIEGSGFTI